LERH